jgi:hypothetical protein
MRHCLHLILGMCLLAVPLSATHLRSGQIIVEQIITGSLTVKITVQVWTNTSSGVHFGGDQDVLQFGDGSSAIVPEQMNQPAPELPGNFGMASYTIQHTYQGYGSYVVSFREPNRNEGILNISNSVGTMFYLESYFHLLETAAYKSPIPLQQPVFISDTSTPLETSIAATDNNDFALKYVTVVPRQDVNTDVIGYTQPASFNISEHLGMMTWDNVFQGAKHEGEYLFTARIEQYQWTDAGWLLMGYMYRDFQIILIDSGIDASGYVQDNLSDEENKLYSENSQNNSFRVFAYHESGETVTTAVKTELPSKNIEITSYDSTHQDQNILVTKVSVSTTEDIVRNNPFLISTRSTFTNGELVYIKDLNVVLFTSMVDFFEPLGPLAARPAENETITLAPNPVGQFVTVSGTPGKSTITIINFQGQNIMEMSVTNDAPLDVSQLPPGLYFVIVKDQHQNVRSREKIIKQ